jgi:hypothetical protein
MFRLWYIAGALALWVIVYQVYFRYDYTMQNGYAVARYDRLTGKTCGIPQCLPPTPTPVPTATPTPVPTLFRPALVYRQVQRRFADEAREAVDMVKRTQFGEELMRSPGAKRFVWTSELADRVAGSLFALHDPSLRHALPITQKYMDSLNGPAYRVDLVCFCSRSGAGYRWEVDLNARKVRYVNDDPKLEKKYGLTPADEP